jgi:hypothetical protein
MNTEGEKPPQTTAWQVGSPGSSEGYESLDWDVSPADESSQRLLTQSHQARTTKSVHFRLASGNACRDLGLSIFVSVITLSIIPFLLSPFRTASSGSQPGSSSDSDWFRLAPTKGSPIAFMDVDGLYRWTVDIPPDGEFPLEPLQYANICRTIQHGAWKHKGPDGHEAHSHGHFAYYHVDKDFMDVEEAESLGFIHNQSYGHEVKATTDSPETEICSKSLTYVLESADAGLGHVLMGLWMSYGLARKEGRAFFIDDRKW